MVEEPVRLHCVRVIYEVEVDGGPLRPEEDGSTDAVRWVHDRDLENLALIPWLKELGLTTSTKTDGARSDPSRVPDLQND